LRGNEIPGNKYREETYLEGEEQQHATIWSSSLQTEIGVDITAIIDIQNWDIRCRQGIEENQGIKVPGEK
jgi:hypothetical protein